MKKMYAALLAAALLTAGAGLNAQAADWGNFTGITVQNTSGPAAIQLKNDAGDNVVEAYDDGSLKATGNVSVGGSLTVGDVSINGGQLTATEAHLNGGMYATGKGQFDGGVSGSSGEFDTLTVAGKDVATQAAVDDNTAAITQEATDRKAADEQLSQDITAQGETIAAQGTQITQQGQQINALSDRVSDLGDEIDNVGAISAALAGLHPLDYDGTGSKFQLAAAMGNYDGTQAAAIGGFYHFNEDVMMSVGGATSFGGDNKSAFNVGVSFRVGQGSSGKKVSSDAVLAQLEAMNEKIAALEAENQSLSEKVAALEAPAPAAE